MTLNATTLYYWRIDEVQGGGSVIKGPVWQFSTSAPNPGTNALTMVVRRLKAFDYDER